MVPDPPPPVIHDPPRTVKQPSERFKPLANVEVPDPPTLITPDVWITPADVVATPTPRPPVVYVFPWIANAASEEGEEVPIPTTPDEVSVSRGIEDEAYASEEVPTMRVPFEFVKSQCF